MANSLTSLSPTMIQDEVMPALKLGLSPINAASVKIAASPVEVGGSTLVPIIAGRTAGTYSSTFADNTGNTLTSASVTWTAPKFASWYVNPNTEAMPTAERFLAEGRECAYAVAKACVQDVLGKYLEANIGSTENTDELVVAAADYDVDDQATLWGMIKTKGVNGGISAIHNIAYATNLLKDNALQDRSASGSDMLMTGELPPVLGANQYYTDAFPTAVTNQNTGVIYTGKQTVAVALGVPNSVQEGLENASGVRIELITDPDSGVQMVWRTWVDSNTGIYWGSVYVMCDSVFVQDAAVRVVSA